MGRSQRFGKPWALGLATYVGTLLLAGHADAVQATWRRVSVAGVCQAPWYTTPGTPVTFTFGVARVDATNVGVMCAVPSDSTLPHNQVLTLNVFGGFINPNGTYDITGTDYNNASSKACVKTYNTSFTSCGVEKAWYYGSAYGVDTSAWLADPNGFPYVQTKPAYDLGNNRALPVIYGFYLSN